MAINFKIKVALVSKLAPRGAGAKLKLTTDPLSKAILSQELWVWWQGDPHQSRLTLQLDDQPEAVPIWVWLNPGVTDRAIVRITDPEIPDDGVTHRLTVRIWELKDGEPCSAPAVLPLAGGIKRLPTTEQPEWCGATLRRQATPDTDALIHVQWRHPGAVKIVAHATKAGTFILGYADADEHECFIEDLGGKLTDHTEQVRIGVCAIDGGQFGLPTWSEPLLLNWHKPPMVYPRNPDQATAVKLNQYGLESFITSTINANPNLPDITSWTTTTILNTLTRRIKDIVRKGGSVTLDDLGRIEARWNPDRTTRGIGFSASPGFIEGTRRGQPLTDAQAKGAA
ncbi:hypothetical protein [Thiobaca trueperi]|uniref:Uncharacterized protein n=1 Tax=Thiobaca trueperi TaxID=127458 RepID=A0A4R3MZZ9_9GAMM|nr:hypothetical protein [Thiobaca trueperi]TCT21196.1 hypothetical protein EDC35_10449 [Thiobaca trueperi]